MGALAGAIAIVFRQTNIVWLLFSIGLVAVRKVEKFLKKEKGVRESLHSLGDLRVLRLCVDSVFDDPKIFSILLLNILWSSLWYLLVLCLFVAFIIMNKGIVVGDRSNHQAVLNFPQLFYFLGVSAFFSVLHIVSIQKLKRFIVATVCNPVKFFLLFSIMSILAWTFTYEHKYTLSDNRHYTFYVWSRIYRRHPLVKLILVPGYIYCLYHFSSLLRNNNVLWRLVFSICAFVVLVPQALFEFRYFIIPFFIMRLNMKLPCAKVLFIESLVFMLINLFTVYMFVEKPFLWPNSNQPQRFMW